MARVYLLSVYEDQAYDPNTHYALESLKHSAAIDRFRIHTLVSDAAEADIILFVEMGTTGMFAEVVRAHPLYRRYPQKCFLYDWSDHVFPVIPGIYSSLRKEHFSPEHTRSGFYLLPENPYIQNSPVSGKEKYLAAFVGSLKNHPVRQAFLKFGRDDIYLLDSSKESYRILYHGTPEEKDLFWQRYAASIRDALFSLCPRGLGPGTIRLYESMKMGRACVILSDEWVPNDGVDWDSFAVRLPESEVHRTPEILDSLRDRAAEMGRRARQEWEDWFSEPVRFHRMVELCLSMKNARRQYGFLRRIKHYHHIARPGNWRMYVRSKAILYRRNKKIYW